MRFRFKAFSVHLLSSASVLTLTLGALYFGWYRWPGWYLTDVSRVALVMICVDVVLGPTLTFIIADKSKPRRELVRDIGIIVALQLGALGYGTVSLWNGRPLYYAFSENVLQLVQAYDIDADEAALGRQQNPQFAPHWYSLPRWIWAPLPQNADTRAKIVTAAVSGGDDVISMPKYFKRWEDGLPALRAQLKTVDKVAYFAKSQKKQLTEKMRAAGFADDQADTIPLTGRGHPLLAVIDPKTMAIKGIFTAK
ncbi:MAG TPA: hypothetical protein VHW71_14760 [Steroidobacteraceae bacterium]|nr:hypothetical protein [Steroidobacteraceae bacterium]